MLRFSFRSRRKDVRRSVTRRSQKPVAATPQSQLRVDSPISGAPASFLVNYDTLPVRRPDGNAVDYEVYQPSPYFKPAPSRTRRRTRAQKQSQVNANNTNCRSSVINDLGLDFDTLQRSKTTGPADDILQLIPIEKRIRIKIAELRDLLQQGEALGAIEELKELVNIHNDKLNSYSLVVQTARARVTEAKTVTGIKDKTGMSNGTHRKLLVRKVTGKPSRIGGDRTATALKSRTSSMRSAPRTNQRSMHEHRHDESKSSGREHKPPGPSKGKIELNKLTRKSSARLRRLGSAGSILIRRLSKVSAAEDTSTGSSGETPNFSVLDEEAIRRLRGNPTDIIGSYEADLEQALLATDIESGKLQEAQAKLQERRDIHDKVMMILDQFYGSMPGWEGDPISVKMLPDTADMTEAGIEAERDLAEVRLMREQIFAAYEDHGHALHTLGVVSMTMSLFVERLEAIASSFDHPDGAAVRANDLLVINQEALSEEFSYLERLMQKCARNSKVAGQCCIEAPRVDQIARDIGKLDEGFRREFHAILRRGAIYRNGFIPTLHVSKSTLCDCKLAESFVAERRKMISQDLESFDEKVERYEEYVVLERIGILDAYHPIREGR